jgi:hypothetical protein
MKESENQFKDFRVREGDEANVMKWPKTVNPVLARKAKFYSCRNAFS